MDCTGCTRTDSSSRFYCSDCLNSRLKDHYQRRSQLRNALTLVTAKAAALLGGTERGASGGGAGAKAFGVAEERQLKADKWTHGIRVYTTREAVVKGKQANDTTAQALADRRASLARRRANLHTARSLLSSLDPPPSPTSPSPIAASSSSSLPLSLPALSASIDTLRTALDALTAESSRVRQILAVELLAVYALQPVEPVLADPFSPIPSSSSNFPSPLSRTLRPPPPSQSPVAFPRSYTLATLPLPPLSLLPTLPPTTLEPLLSHLLHLVRLLALYDGEVLPWAPVMGMFGPGRAGVRAVKGMGVGGDEEVEEGGGGAERGEGDGAATPKGKKGEKAVSSGVGVDVWPLCFGSSSSSTSASSSSASPSSRSSSTASRARTTSSESSSRLDDSSSRSSSSSAAFSHLTLTPSDPSPPPNSSSAKTSKKSSTRRSKAVLGGAVALAYDLAWLVWRREVTEGVAGGKREWKEEDLEDLGGLVMRAAGVSTGEDDERSSTTTALATASTQDPASPFLDPSPPSSPPPTLPHLSFRRSSPSSSPPPPPHPVFPLSFPSLLKRYTELAFPPPSTSLLEGEENGRTPKRRGGGKGRGVEEGEGGGASDEEGDDDEWDFV